MVFTIKSDKKHKKRKIGGVTTNKRSWDEAINNTTKEYNDSPNDVGTYIGSMKDDKRHGYGKMTYLIMSNIGKEKSRIYEGFWNNDVHDYSQKVKITKMFHPGVGGRISKTYEGKIDSEGEEDGHGVLQCVLVNGEWKYEGNFKHGEYYGKGRMIYANGDEYNGYWEKNEWNGKGVLLQNGNKYNGEFKDNQFTEGVMKYANGDKFHGEWISNFKTGQGIMIYANGERYNGYWEEDKRTGRGVMKFKTGGSTNYKTGDVYKGEWYQDSMDGKGKLLYDNGEIYEGDWEANKKEGHGTMTYIDGQEKSGIWRNDKFVEKIQLDTKIQVDTTLQNNVSYKSVAPDPYNPHPDYDEHLIDIMKDNPNFVAFKFHGKFSVVRKESLKSLIDLDSFENKIFYECIETGTLRPENIVAEKPLLNLRSVGVLSGGYIDYRYILDVINGTHRYFLIYDPKLPVLKSVVSDNVLNHHGSHVSSAHCQAGQDGKLFEMKYIKDFEYSATKIKKIYKTYKNQKNKTMGGKHRNPRNKRTSKKMKYSW